jgi:hemerythrin-like domain-containing protein
MDVLTQLSDEHERLRAHLERVQAAAEARDGEALRVTLQAASAALTDELDNHIAVEEAEVFAAIAEALGEGLLEPFREEHVEVRVLRDEVFAAMERGEAPHEGALALCELIQNHQQREDLLLFPGARTALAFEQLTLS